MSKLVVGKAVYLGDGDNIKRQIISKQLSDLKRAKVERTQRERLAMEKRLDELLGFIDDRLNDKERGKRPWDTFEKENMMAILMDQQDW